MLISELREIKRVNKHILEKVNDLEKNNEELMNVCTSISRFLKKEKISNIDQYKVRLY